MAVLAVWLRYAFNRLWQKSLMNDAAESIKDAQAMGLTVHPAGFGASVHAYGTVSGRRIRIRWSGGLLGERTTIWVDRLRTSGPLLTRAGSLQRALSDGLGSDE